jgi:hypothetical protein
LLSIREFNEALWIYNKLKNHTEQDTSLPPTLQARLHTLAARLSRHGVLELPFQTSLEEAYAVVSAEGVDEGHKVALVEAALDCLDFDKAQKILDQLLSSERKEPKPYLLLARCLTQKAEWKRLCNVALVRNHAPLVILSLNQLIIPSNQLLTSCSKVIWKYL